MNDVVCDTMPGWLPETVRLYLHHTAEGVPLRALARDRGVNASTVSRQVRRYELRRDDPLMDEALTALVPHVCGKMGSEPGATALAPTNFGRLKSLPMPDEARLNAEARRLLRRLSEPGAVLVFSQVLEKSVILRDHPDGRQVRTAVLDRAVARAFSLKDWIICRKAGRISTYEISQAGRAALRAILADDHRNHVFGLPGLAVTKPLGIGNRLGGADGVARAKFARAKFEQGAMAHSARHGLLNRSRGAETKMAAIF